MQITRRSVRTPDARRSHRTSRRIVALLLPTLVSAAVLPAAGQSRAPAGGAAAADAAPSPREAGRPPYKVLATRRASTLEQELNGGAADGYRLHSITWKRQLYGTFLFPFPGDRNEVAALTVLDGRPGRFRYRVLRGLSEADLETALNEAAQEGFGVRSVGKFIVLERDDAGTSARREYEVVTTSKVTTSKRSCARCVTTDMRRSVFCLRAARSKGSSRSCRARRGTSAPRRRPRPDHRGGAPESRRTGVVQRLA